MKEWYLMTDLNRPHVIGGFEKDSFDEYKEDSFEEVLDNEFLTTVIWYNNDMSESKEVKCIIQDNLSDTMLKSLERTVLFPIGIVKAGEYIFYENNYWLVVSYPDNNKFYEKAVIYLCQYCIRWQNNKGETFDRWVNLNSASKYSMGEKESNYMITLTSNDVMLVGYDENLLDLDGKRIFIDRKKENPNIVFKVTRSDDVFYNYGEDGGSILSFILDRDEYDKDKDNRELRICDYKPTELFDGRENSDEDKGMLTACIIGNDRLKIGYSRTYTVDFKDDSGNSIALKPTDFKWDISDDSMNKHLEFSYPKDNKIKVKCLKDEELIGRKFNLRIKIKDKIVGNLLIVITDVYD